MKGSVLYEGHGCASWQQEAEPYKQGLLHP